MNIDIRGLVLTALANLSYPYRHLGYSCLLGPKSTEKISHAAAERIFQSINNMQAHGCPCSLAYTSTPENGEVYDSPFANLVFAIALFHESGGPSVCMAEQEFFYNIA